MEFMDTVLIVGGGGREHAILKALLRTERPLCTFAYPGNPGMEDDGCMLVHNDIRTWDDLAAWAEANEIGLTIVGPEVPLVEGVVDAFAKRGLCAFGPSQKAAMIEGSKSFAKNLMHDHGIPTAEFEIFTDRKSAASYVKKLGGACVVKVNGLAAGKGAIVCDTQAEATDALKRILDKKQFGAAGESVVVEEKLKGEEASVLVLSDGKDYRILPVSQDHKRVGDNDMGPNTGGMGAYAPAPLVDEEMLERIEAEIVRPTLAAMSAEGATYKGVLYCGIMVTENGPKVIEYNCRFGDPEAQAVLPLVTCDWYAIFRACMQGRITGLDWQVSTGACATVVMASGGYPGSYESGKLITGISDAEDLGVDVYHAGTSRNQEGDLVTNGGRVLAVSGRGDTLEQAIRVAYEGVAEIDFEGRYYRSDIGVKGLRRQK